MPGFQSEKSKSSRDTSASLALAFLIAESRSREDLSRSLTNSPLEVRDEVSPALPATSFRALRHRGAGHLGAQGRQLGLPRHRAHSRRVAGRSADLAEGERQEIALDAVARVWSIDRGDVLRAQDHALERCVGAHAFDREGLGDHDVSLLDVPAQDHLRRRRAQFLGDLCDRRILQVGAMAQR